MKTDLLFNEKLTQKANYSPKLLDFAAKFWFIIATIGQWIFGFYVVSVYHVSTFKGDFEKWNTVLPKGYIAGDWKGNLMVGIHVILAAIMVIGGPLQFIPQIRERFRTFHRWLGRVYVITAIIVSSAGFIMVWTRGTVGDIFMHVTNSIQAFYIIIFAILTIRFAIYKQFSRHRIWALRLFMVANGVWFFRVGLMSWLVINQAPVGFNPETFTGPFLWVLSTFAYAVPISLILLEMYFYAQKKQNQVFSNITSVIIFLFTIIMTIGIFGATMGMWLPRI
jgi:Predicted membrane protein (DUF2306)